ncbi:hypothetical protein Tco_0551251 [Tanacetum coccineum]
MEYKPQGRKEKEGQEKEIRLERVFSTSRYVVPTGRVVIPTSSLYSCEEDQEDGGEPDVDLDALNALANAAVTIDSTKSPGGPSKNPAACSYDPISDVPSTMFPTDVPSGVALTGPSTISPGSTTVPTSSSVPTKTIPASSGTTTATPSSPVRDAKKGKGVAIEEPTPTQAKTFKQLEEERLARQMSQDFEMTKDQRKRQQEVLASATNYSDAAWDIILSRLQANLDLSSTIFGVEFTDDDFATRMVALVNSRRKELAKKWAQERRDRPMTPAQLRQYMRTYLQEEFDKIQRAFAFTRGLKRDGSPMTCASSKKLKTGDVAVDIEVPSHSDVEVPPNIASKAHPTASSLKKIGTKKKRLGRKGIHTSHSTIPIEEGDPDAEHKLCIKYASDEDSASDCDTPVYLYAIVDWELFPIGLGSINTIYRLDNSRKYFTSHREILHLVTITDLMMIYGRVMTFYQDKKVEGLGLVLLGDLQILMDSLELVVWLYICLWTKKYPLSVNLIERMLDHQLEICHGTVGNELTTAVQLIAFLKKQISDSMRPKVHEWVINSPCYHNKELASPEQTATAEVVPKSVAGSSFPAASSTYVVPTGRVVVPNGWYIVPTGKVIIIASTVRLSLVPTGRVLSPGRVK